MDNERSSQSEASGMSEFITESWDEDHFQRRINDIRMQLDDTYNIFVNARDTLSSISFESLSERLKSDSSPSTCETAADGEQVKQEIALVRDSNNRLDVLKSLEQLDSLPKDPQRAKKMKDIPELNKFFDAISNLMVGIKQINGHQQSIVELNEDVNNGSEGSKKATGSRKSLPSRLANMNID